jgi:endonuclease-3
MIRSRRDMGGRLRNSTPARQIGGAKAAPNAVGAKEIAAAEATKIRAAQLAQLLAVAWPDARVELDHENAYQLLVATILAAQSTDKTINTITPALFVKYPDANALAQADQTELEKLIVKSGFFRNKAKHLIGMAQAVVTRHGGEIPRTMDELCALPGVARKTANVVSSELGNPRGVVVDTHVRRLSQRLGFTKQEDPVKIERDLMKLVPRDDWARFPHLLIWHGRRVCDARKPRCEDCVVNDLCPSSRV